MGAVVQIFLDKRQLIDYIRNKGQITLKIPIVCEGSAESDEIVFIYDTGAYITVICREDYEWYRLDKLPRKKTTIGGYVGSTPGYVYQIPGLRVGRRLLRGVWAFTPESMDIEQNLLGNNVIEYFNVVQDNQHDCFYFLNNPAPEPYTHPESKFSFACDSVLILDDTSPGTGSG